MKCSFCEKEIKNDAMFCPHCGTENKEAIKNSNGLVTPLKDKTKREKINLFGVELPILYISLFCVILGYGGYITPLLLLTGVLLLATVESKTLTSNLLVVFGLYASQFTIETVLTFIASIPTSFLGWLAKVGGSSIEFTTKIGNISNGISAIFGVIDSVIGLCFFAMYIMAIISLLKSDKIKIPFVSNLVKKITT